MVRLGLHHMLEVAIARRQPLHQTEVWQLGWPKRELPHPRHRNAAAAATTAATAATRCPPPGPDRELQ